MEITTSDQYQPKSVMMKTLYTILQSLVKIIVGSLRDREVACSASDRQGSNFESCVWRTVSSQSSHHPQEVLLAQFSLYVHKGGLKPDSFHFPCENSSYGAGHFIPGGGAGLYVFFVKNNLFTKLTLKKVCSMKCGKKLLVHLFVR